jgi:short-subunit dehydrogenase
LDSVRPFAVVTGASSGIGKAFAEAFARRGTDVLVIARRSDRLNALAVELQNIFKVSVHVLVADLTDSIDLSAVVNRLQNLERIDFLINCAGFGTYGCFAEIDPRRIRDELLLDLIAPVVLTRAALPAMMAQRGGVIINVSSMAGFLPIPHHATYCAAKAGLTRFTEALSGEMVGTGVRLYALCPGPVPTEFFGISGYKLEDVPKYMLQSVSGCVEATFKAMQRPSVVSIPHWLTWLFVTVLKMFPLAIRLRILGHGPEWLNGKR